MAKSIVTSPFLSSGAIADSGMMLYQLCFTSCRTRCRYGPKSTPCVSVVISNGPMRAVFCRWPRPRSPPSPAYLLRDSAAARVASSIALPADMPWVLKLGFWVTGGFCSLATWAGGGGCCCCGGACCCGAGLWACCGASCFGSGGAVGPGLPAREASSNFFNCSRFNFGCFDIATRFLSDIWFVCGRCTFCVSGGAVRKVSSFC